MIFFCYDRFDSKKSNWFKVGVEMFFVTAILNIIQYHKTSSFLSFWYSE